MRGVAQYAMLGRRQSIIMVLLCGFFPVAYCISAAVVGLVHLRKGMREGLLVLLWSLLPAAYFWNIGDPSPLLLMVGITILSQVLRRSGSWAQVLMVALVLGILTQVSLYWQTAYVEQVRQLMEQALQTRQVGGNQDEALEQLVQLLLRFYGVYHMGLVVLCLMLARWWQAALYNPGGFREEFHQLRLDPRFSLVLAVMIVAGALGIPPLNNWVALLSLPLLVNGIALCHGVVGMKQLGTHWLVMCYLTLLLMAPALVMLGIMDSFLDLRKRIRV